MTRDNENIFASNVVDNVMGLLQTAIKFSRNDDAQIKLIKDSWCYFTGSQSPFLNGVFHISNNDKDQHQYFDKIMKFFSSKKVPFSWWWLKQDPIPESIHNELKYFSFSPQDRNVGINLILEDVKFLTVSKKIVVKQVTRNAEYQIFVNIFAKVFQLTKAEKLDFASIFQAYGIDKPFKHYLGYYQNEPVATLTSYINNFTLGLYNASTLPSVQGKGLCSALLQHSINEARRLGYKFAVAQLEPPGFAAGLTNKLGFSTCCYLSPFVQRWK